MTSEELCPVCATPQEEPPWRGESASLQICDSCGIQFGYNDARPDVRDSVHAAWRRRWIANGRQPLHPSPTFDELMASEQ